MTTCNNAIVITLLTTLETGRSEVSEMNESKILIEMVVRVMRLRMTVIWFGIGKCEIGKTMDDEVVS